MTSKTTQGDTEGVEAWRDRLTGPLEIQIEGATAYWLEDLDGRTLSQEFERTVELLAGVLRQVDAGVNPCDVIVWSRLADGRRYRVGGGDMLLALAHRTTGPGRGGRT